MIKTTQTTDRSEVLEADFSKELKPYATATSQTKKREIARASSEQEVDPEPSKRTVLKVSQKDCFDAMTNEERAEVFRKKSNRLYDFLVTDLGMKTLTLE